MAWQPGHWLPTAAPHAPVAPPCHLFPRWTSWLGCPLLQPGGEDAPLPPRATPWVWAGTQGLGCPAPSSIEDRAAPGSEPWASGGVCDTWRGAGCGGPCPGGEAPRGRANGERPVTPEGQSLSEVQFSPASWLRWSLRRASGEHHVPAAVLTHCLACPTSALATPPPSFRPPASSPPGSLPGPPRSPGQAQCPVVVPRPAVCVPRRGTSQPPRRVPVPGGASLGGAPPLQRSALSQAD